MYALCVHLIAYDVELTDVLVHFCELLPEYKYNVTLAPDAGVPDV